MSVAFNTRDFVGWLDNVERSMESRVLAEANAEAKAATEAMREHGYQNRTGKLTSSMGFRVMHTQGLGFFGVIETKVPYALWVDDKTKPHDIWAKHAKYLRFVVHGNVFFRKHVHHPGTKGAHFSDHAEQLLNEASAARMQQAVDAAIAASG